MSKGGVQPTPRNLKLLTKPTGSTMKDRSQSHRNNPGNVEPDMDPLNGDVPDAPADLKVGSEGRRYWRLYWKHAGGWLVRADYPLVVRLCRMHNVAERMMHTIEGDGMFVQSESTGKHHAHTLLAAYDRVIGRIERLEDRLGLNPVERSRIRVQPKEKETALDRWNSDRSGTVTTKP